MNASHAPPGPEYQPRREPRRERIELRGLAIGVTRWGPPEREPLVLLHGFLDCAATWQFLVDALPEGWAIAAPDWRGFGDSAWAPDGYWFPDYLADLDALLEALVPGAPARVVAHSMGGNVASLYAGVRTTRLAWLANLEGMGLPRTAPEDAPARYLRWLDELRGPERAPVYASIEQLAHKLRHRNPRLPAERARFIARAWTRPDGQGRFVLAADPRHRRVNPVLYRIEETEACWRRAVLPMIMVLGEHSQLRAHLDGDSSGGYLRELFQNLEVATLPGAGHMMHHEEPAALARLIEQFAARQAPGGAR